MSLGSCFKGTSAEQNTKFANKELKMIEAIDWPVEFNVRVDMLKVNLVI